MNAAEYMWLRNCGVIDPERALHDPPGPRDGAMLACFFCKTELVECYACGYYCECDPGPLCECHALDEDLRAPGEPERFHMYDLWHWGNNSLLDYKPEAFAGVRFYHPDSQLHSLLSGQGVSSQWDALRQPIFTEYNQIPSAHVEWPVRPCLSLDSLIGASHPE